MSTEGSDNEHNDHNHLERSLFDDQEAKRLSTAAAATKRPITIAEPRPTDPTATGAARIQTKPLVVGSVGEAAQDALGPEVEKRKFR